MNCNCGIPAVIFTAKQGDHTGKEFATCAGSSGVKCAFFHWMDSKVPPKTTSYISNPNKYNSLAPSSSSSSKSSNNINNNNNNNNQRLLVKLALDFFDIGPPISAWFSAIHHRNDLLTNYYETIPPAQKQYIENKKLWVFDLAIYDQFVIQLQNTFAVELFELPQFVIKGLQTFIKMRQADKVVVAVDPVLNIQPALYDKLLPFQLAGVKYIVRRGGRGFIGDEMGLGKTIQAIALLQHYRQHWPALVMMPVTLLKQWENELMKFSSDILGTKDIAVIRKEKDIIGKARIVLVPYTMVEKMADSGKLHPERFGIVIADESHNLKNKDAKRTAAALPFLQTAGVSICLSGTPAINRPAELFTQLSALLPKVFNDYNAFVLRYCDAKESFFQRGQLDVRGSSNEIELKLLLESMCLIRRLKVDTLDSLPQKSREVKYINADPAHARDLSLLKKRGDDLQKKSKVPGLGEEARKRLKMEEDQVLMQLYSLTGIAKINAICGELQGLLNIAKQERGAAEARDDVGRSAKESAPLFVDGDEDYLLVDEGKKEGSSSSRGAPEIHSLVDDDEDLLPLYALPERKVVSIDLTEEEPARKRGKVVCGPGAVVPALEPDDFMQMKADEAYDLLQDFRDDSQSSAKKVVLRSRLIKAVKEKEKEQHENYDDLLVDSDDGSDSGDRRRSRLKKGASKGCSWRKVNGIPIPVNDDDEEDEDEDKEEEWEEELDGVKGGGKKRSRPPALAALDRDLDGVGDEWRDVLGSADDASQSEVKGGLGRVTEPLPGEWRDVLDSQDGEDDEENISKIKKSFFSGPSWAPTAALKKSGQKAPQKAPSKKAVKASPKKKFRGLGQKIIVFAHHVNVMDAVQNFLVRNDILHIRMDGSTSITKRNELVQKFQEDDDTEVALLSISACGVGLNLTRANAALFAELTWSVGMILQAEDRIHRLGQKSDMCRIVYLLCRNSCDDMMFDMLQKKHSMIGESVGISGHTSAGMIIDKKMNDKVERPVQAELPLTAAPKPTPVVNAAPAARPPGGSPAKTIDAFFAKAPAPQTVKPAVQHIIGSIQDYAKIAAAPPPPTLLALPPAPQHTAPLSEETRRLIEAKKEEARRRFLAKQAAEALPLQVQNTNTFSTARGTTFTARSLD